MAKMWKSLIRFAIRAAFDHSTHSLIGWLHACLRRGTGALRIGACRRSLCSGTGTAQTAEPVPHPVAMGRTQRTVMNNAGSRQSQGVEVVNEVP